jgi:hypothetical protein
VNRPQPPAPTPDSLNDLFARFEESAETLRAARAVYDNLREALVDRFSEATGSF